MLQGTFRSLSAELITVAGTLVW